MGNPLKTRLAVRSFSNFNLVLILESHLESISLCKLYEFLDNASLRKKTRLSKDGLPFAYKVSCTIFDLYTVIKKYNLSKVFDYNTVDKCTLSDTKISFPKDINTYVCCKNGIYGSRCYNLNINGQFVQTIIDGKNAKFKKDLNIVKLKEVELSKLVFFDIETTGLSEIEDDIIEFALYDFETKKHFSKRLPLNKKKSIPEEVSKINHITDEMLLDATPLTQAEVDNIIKDFELDKKYLAIWTGSNLFDASFVCIYFFDNNLSGFDRLSFFNARSFSKEKIAYNLADYSKDYVAKYFGISTDLSHSALGDCIIEAEIMKYILELDNWNLQPQIIIDLIDGKLNETNAQSYYDRLIDYCRNKNGPVLNDYDSNPRRRGSEWIDIHHVGESIIDNISSRTYEAIKTNDLKTLRLLKPLNKASMLVYATKVEHFLIHYIIEYLRGPGAGPHWIFGDILRAKFNIADSTRNEPIKINNFLKEITFDQLTDIYMRILKKDQLNKKDVFKFYKLETTTKEIDDFIDSLFL